MRLQIEANRLLAGEFASICRHRAKPVNEGRRSRMGMAGMRRSRMGMAGMRRSRMGMALEEAGSGGSAEKSYE